MVKQNGWISELYKNKILYLMTIPAILLVFIFNYIPMAGMIMAFKDTRGSTTYFGGEWIKFKNFEFFFKSQDAARITFNTLFMNAIFIISVLVVSMTFALLLNEINSRKIVKLYQSTMFLPNFLSWVIVGFLAYAFLSVDSGLINSTLKTFGIKPIAWYSEPQYWRFILPIVNMIKNAGYYTVIFYAGTLAISEELYEAAKIDGASRFQQMYSITIPLVIPLVSIMVLLQIGRIFYADFGLFYYIPRETGVLFSTTDVIDTYVYRSLRVLGNTGMATAVGVFQSIVGLIVVATSNWVVKKVNPENALF